MRSSALLRSYKRARNFRRAMLVIFFAVFLATICYAAPWVPYGLTENDYNQRVAPMAFLCLAAAISAFGAVHMRERSQRLEQTLLTWTSLHEGLGDLRRREYFFERVAIACQRAQADGAPFAVVVLRLDGTEGVDLEGAILTLESKIAGEQRFSVLGPREIGVIATSETPAEAEAYATGLCLALANSRRAGAASAGSGWSLFGVDAVEAGALVGIARSRLHGDASSPADDSGLDQEKKVVAA